MLTMTMTIKVFINSINTAGEDTTVLAGLGFNWTVVYGDLAETTHVSVELNFIDY